MNEGVPYFAARESGEMRLEIFPHDLVQGDEAKDAGFTHRALSVIVSLIKEGDERCSLRYCIPGMKDARFIIISLIKEGEGKKGMKDVLFVIVSLG